MDTVTIPKKAFTKILEDVETLIDDVELALDAKVQERLSDIKKNPSIGKTEKDLDNNLKKRGVKIGRMEDRVTS